MRALQLSEDNLVKLTTLCLFSAAALCAQTLKTAPPAAAPKNPLVATSQALYAISKTTVTRSLDKIPDSLWDYRPVSTVRTVGQLFAHIADGQYEFCGSAKGEQIQKDVEGHAKTREQVAAALKEAFSYCDSVYAGMTDQSAAGIAEFFGQKMAQLGIMDLNIAHNQEHYGNLVTYMRINGIVPPTSAK
jgi:uncharacterized damage-inducible protein DinB